MNVLIVGCGYVGTELARKLLAQGHLVWGLRRSDKELPAGVVPLRGDVGAEGGLGELDQLDAELDAVVYAVSPSSGSEEDYWRAYVEGPTHLATALSYRVAYRGMKYPQRQILISSTGVYGQQNGEWLNEDTPPEASNERARNMLLGEQLFGRGGIVVRLSGIYGPGRTHVIDSVRNGLARLSKGPVRVLNHIHVEDAAAMLAHLLNLPAPAPLYLGVDDEPADRNEILSWLSRAMGLPNPPFAEANASRGVTRGGHRYYSNGLIKSMGFTFRYPTYREGYGALMRGDR